MNRKTHVESGLHCRLGKVALKLKQLGYVVETEGFGLFGCLLALLPYYLPRVPLLSAFRVIFHFQEELATKVRIRLNPVEKKIHVQ